MGFIAMAELITKPIGCAVRKHHLICKRCSTTHKRSDGKNLIKPIFDDSSALLKESDDDVDFIIYLHTHKTGRIIGAGICLMPL